MDGIQEVSLGPAWDRMVNLVTNHRRMHPVPKMIVSSEKWATVLDRANDKDRQTLALLKALGQIIVTDLLPDPEVAYVLALPVDDLPVK